MNLFKWTRKQYAHVYLCPVHIAAKVVHYIALDDDGFMWVAEICDMQLAV